MFRAGLALEAGDLDDAARFAEHAYPVIERTAPGVIGLEFHLACRRGDVVEARRRLVAYRQAVSSIGVADAGQLHDLLTAALAAGLSPDEMRPVTDLAGGYVGHRLPADHPWRRLLDAQLAEAEGRTADGRRPVRRRPPGRWAWPPR